jgi:hypothetical protein
MRSDFIVIPRSSAEESREHKRRSRMHLLRTVLSIALWLALCLAAPLSLR